MLARETRNPSTEFPSKAVFINGDLTAYGHPWQFEEYKRQIAKLSPSLGFFPGLGNHDYKNNVNDTIFNRAANGMVLYMLDWIRTNKDKLISYDVTSITHGRVFSDVHTIQGSLSYSFDIEGVHFVQTQYFPSYQAKWNGENSFVCNLKFRLFFF